MVHLALNYDDFKEVIGLPGKTVFVDVFALWCGPCKVIAPVFEKLSKEHPECMFIKVDADEVEAVTEEYQIESLPTFLVFKDGKKVDSMTGGAPEKLQQFIEKHA